MRRTGTDAGSQTGRVMAAIRHRIDNRMLAAGDRLPSVRAFAVTMQVSPSTVVDAYDRLAADGLIRAKPGSGFYVQTPPTQPVKLAADGPSRVRAVDPFWVSRLSLDAEETVPKPGCGWLPADFMPEAAIRRALRSLSRGASGPLLDYGGTRGSAPLRRVLTRRAADDGLDVHPDQIMLAASGSQAIDLVCRFLLKPGDTVVVDDPCYFNFQTVLKAHQANVVSVPFTPAGPDIAAFEAVLRQHGPRLYLTNSALHNPTGATLSPQVAHRLLNLAAAHDLTIVEDDIFADFEPEPSVRLAALDGLARVIRTGSFSKTLSASIRCGYVMARADWIDGLIDLQVASQFGGPSPMAGEIVTELLTGGSYRRHMEEVRRRLARARRDVAERLTRLGFETWHMPRGGFYLWCRLPDGQSSTALAETAMREGVVLAPGNVFSASQTAEAFMHFNVAQMRDEQTWSLLERMAR